MEYTKLKRVFVTSLLSGSIILSAGTVAANVSTYKNATFVVQHDVELDKDNMKLNQEEALKPKGFKYEERFSKALDTLVERGTITKEKVEEINSYLKKHKEEKKEFHDKMKGMSQDDRREYFKNSKRERKSIIEKMVEDGVITEKQGIELRKALKENKKKSNK
ncbi:MAG: hypothetical protein WDA24_02835 [Tissierellales bacterium]